MISEMITRAGWAADTQGAEYEGEEEQGPARSKRRMKVRIFNIRTRITGDSLIFVPPCWACRQPAIRTSRAPIP